MAPRSARKLPARKSPGRDRRPDSVRLCAEELESRLVPSSVTFINNVLFIQDSSPVSDTVKISAVGSASDGSTGVKVVSNLLPQGSEVFGGVGDPVLNVAVSLGNGNNTVKITNLTDAYVIVGLGNGNNYTQIGECGGSFVAAGTGSNTVVLGGGLNSGDDFITTPLGATFNCGSAALIGFSYEILNNGTGVTTTGSLPGHGNNIITMEDLPGQAAGTFVSGNGDNTLTTGEGNDLLVVVGNGNNVLNSGPGSNQDEVFGNGNNQITTTGTGDNSIYVKGNGNNVITATGTGSISVIGTGSNTINAGTNAGDAVYLTDAVGASVITAAEGAAVDVNGVFVTTTGFYGPVFVQFV